MQTEYEPPYTTPAEERQERAFDAAMVGADKWVDDDEAKALVAAYLVGTVRVLDQIRDWLYEIRDEYIWEAAQQIPGDDTGDYDHLDEMTTSVDRFIRDTRKAQS